MALPGHDGDCNTIRVHILLHGGALTLHLPHLKTGTDELQWFPCLPVIEAYWDWTLENRRCYAYGSLYVEDHYHTFLSQAIMNMILDIIILLIPTPLLFRQGTEMRTRLGLIGLLILGAAYVPTHDATRMNHYLLTLAVPTS